MLNRSLRGVEWFSEIAPIVPLFIAVLLDSVKLLPVLGEPLGLGLYIFC